MGSSERERERERVKGEEERERGMGGRRKRRGRALAAAAVSLPRDGGCSVSLFTSIGSRQSGADVLGYVCETQAAVCSAVFNQI